LSPQDYEYLCKLLKERSGLVLASDKQYLVESRLLPVARKAGCDTLEALVVRLRMPGSDALKADVTEAMTINESFFFRDKIPYDRFRDTIIPELMQKRATSRRLRVWCAACSTGQEPYSLAMILDGFSTLAGWQFDIIATDISNEVLDKARNGSYSQFEVQRGLPISLLMQHFEQVGDQWRISAKIRKMVHFRQLNLLTDFSTLGQFDVIFCRNVLIYFDQPTKVDVLTRVRERLPSDGYFVLGAAETVVGVSDLFTPIPDKRGLYMPVEKRGTPKLAAVPTQRVVA
jgi:chemotaxis protein methyltransferase CheR